LSGRPLAVLQKLNNIPDSSQPVGHSRRQGRGHPQGSVDSAEVVVHEVEGDTMGQVLDLLGEGPVAERPFVFVAQVLLFGVAEAPDLVAFQDSAGEAPEHFVLVLGADRPRVAEKLSYY